MAISEAYRRGFRRAIQAAASLAFDRKIACETAVEDFCKKYPDDPKWQQSERCAAREATHIWNEILKLKPIAGDSNG